VRPRSRYWPDIVFQVLDNRLQLFVQLPVNEYAHRVRRALLQKLNFLNKQVLCQAGVVDADGANSWNSIRRI